MSIIMDSFEFMEINNQVYYSMYNHEDRFKPKKYKPPFRNDIYPETFDKGDIKACLIWNKTHRTKNYYSMMNKRRFQFFQKLPLWLIMNELSY